MTPSHLLPRRGGKVAGVRVKVADATPAAVRSMVLGAWKHKAPRPLVAMVEGATSARPRASMAMGAKVRIDD